MLATCTLGIDLGGTNIKAGLVADDGSVVHRVRIDTEADRGFDHVFGRLVGVTRELIGIGERLDARASAIGIGVPGPMCHAKGLIHAAPNMPGWINIPLRDRLREALGGDRAVSVENDANAAAFGEFWCGAGRGCRDMVMLTLGTGIGGGVIVDGRLTRGAFDNAGEIGHMIVVAGGRPCPCGQRGCLERYSSASAVALRVKEEMQAGAWCSLAPLVQSGKEITSRDVADAMASGDALATRIWVEACEHLALACVNLQHLLNPERVVIGGGLAEAGAVLLDSLRSHFESLTWRVAPDHPAIVPAMLGDNAGVIGAARLAAEHSGDVR